MQNEIEVKIMLETANVPFIENWLSQQNITTKEQETLENTYFDTPELFFAKEQMGLRVRSKNHQHEITLKMKGEIVGGLHIRPEYNLDLPDKHPDFKRLVSSYNLQIENSDLIAENLQPTFSTDFVRQKWLIQFENSQIEVALDQGLIKNPYGIDPICEVEFELKQGDLQTLLNFINTMPKKDGMWLSSLSKAQRGYLVGRADKIAKEIEKLTACRWQELHKHPRYKYQQQIVDFLRLSPENPQLKSIVSQLENKSILNITEYVVSSIYLSKQLKKLKQFNL